LSAELGQPLDDDQLNAALKDLDLNGDGVIDFEEFRRWYYSGMKSYSENKRKLYRAMNGVDKFNKAAKDPAVKQHIQ
jgi:Ca2+-binding EF-hand superfamily protein